MPSLQKRKGESESKFPFFLTLAEGDHAGQRLGAELDICDSPVCECTDVRIALKDDSDRLLTSFSVDVAGKAESENSDEPGGIQGRPLAERVIRSFAEGDSTSRTPEDLFAAFKAKYPGLMSTYAKRHQKLSALYEAYCRRHPARPTLTGTKVGRNEPCPCGSGKKFKRCCGAS